MTSSGVIPEHSWSSLEHSWNIPGAILDLPGYSWGIPGAIRDCPERFRSCAATSVVEFLEIALTSTL
jgi:hypothetical protein